VTEAPQGKRRRRNGGGWNERWRSEDHQRQPLGELPLPAPQLQVDSLVGAIPLIRLGEPARRDLRLVLAQGQLGALDRRIRIVRILGRLRLRAGTSLTALVTTLNQIEGVQNAEVRGE
jgi:hypothetical protein